jgi:hypothetical protein
MCYYVLQCVTVDDDDHDELLYDNEELLYDNEAMRSCYMTMMIMRSCYMTMMYYDDKLLMI